MMPSEKRALPAEITSYDLLKTVAVILMIADHAGYYFWPDAAAFRIAGRLCVPMWFFLIGYARSRDLGPKLWIGAAVLAAANVATGMSVFPLNILATMILVRLLIDPVMARALPSAERLWGLSLLLAFMALPSGMVCEYGTLGLFPAMCGWLARHRENERANAVRQVFFVGTAAFFSMIEAVLFGLTQVQFMVMSAGIAAVMAMLYLFRPAVFPRLTKAVGPLAHILRLAGRHTAEIYVVHLLLFKFAALYLGDERFGFMDWVWFSATGT